jgi:putative aldouronate transport system permease protein
MALFSVVYHWNEWFMGIIYASDTDKQPVMVMLYQALRQAARSIRDETWEKDAPPTLSIRMALIVVTAFPVVVAYPFFQRYFVKGMLIGSIKG